MRDILFRGFYEKENGTEKVFYNGKWHKGMWVEGCYFMAKDNKYNILHYISEIKGEQIFKIIPETVGQYTGLQDKRGAKIFEGDIIKDTEGNELLVVEGSTAFGFDFRYIKDDDVYVTAFDIGINDDCTNLTSAVVIGNIHDNPELLQ